MARRQKGLNFYKKRRKINTEVVQEIWNWVFCIAVSILLAGVCVFAFGLKTSIIGVSMEPNLYNGQEVFINRFIYQIKSPKSGDVVAFLPNGNQHTHSYVKRVVGVPGEHIQIREGKLYINGIETDENYDKIADAGIAQHEITLGVDEYFLLGDNVNSSEDSRSGSIGSVKRENILGKAWFKTAAKNSALGFVE
ncbi:MAG: signal peptidase I [Lachnospiraceae bacterium]